MKNILFKLTGVAFFLGLTACQEKLDSGNNNSLATVPAVYMSADNTSVSFAK